MPILSDLIDPEVLDFWLECNLNVHLIGLHGVGKTALIKQCFDRAGVYAKYFSSPTMDPWCDFIGIPKERVNGDADSDGNPTPFLDFVLPKDMRDDRVEAFFFDEFNRAHPKVQNAVMELIQFGSINGRTFKNLRVVWIATNPHEEDELAEGVGYNVEKMDPAIADRFHIQFEVPYKPDKAFFYREFGKVMGKGAIDWWSALSPDHQKFCSPRRLEYALRHFMRCGDLRHIFPASTGINISTLVTVLDTGPVKEKLAALHRGQDTRGAKRYLSNENRYAMAMPEIQKKPEWIEFFVPLLDQERIAALIAEEDDIATFVVKAVPKHPHLGEIIEQIFMANTSGTLIRKLDKIVSENYTESTLPPCLQQVAGHMGKMHVRPHFNRASNPDDFAALLRDLKTRDFSGDQETRDKAYMEIHDSICPKLSKEMAIDVLHVLTQISVKTAVQHLERLPKLICITNHTFDQLESATGWSWKQVQAAIGKDIEPFIAKFRKTRLSEYFYYRREWGDGKEKK